MKKKTKIVCEKCWRDDFKSENGLAQHDRKMHPYIPPPAPRKETEYATNEEESFTLVNASKLEIGDVFWHVRKCVITSRTKTEGSNDLQVGTRVTKRWYTTQKPQ